MAVFKIQNKDLVELKSKTFPLERDLQELVDDNLDKIFGLEFIRREFGGQGLSIDTIAYDPQTKAPVLIEYKKDSYQSVIDQGMAYLNWLLSHKGDYQVALTEKLGKREIDWTQPRVLFVAKQFNVHQIYASGFRNAPFELYTYNLNDDVFSIEEVKTPKSDVSINSVLRTKEAQKVASEIKTYTLADRLAKSNDQTKALFDKLQKTILALDERVQEKYLKSYIAYRLRYWNFCSVHFYIQKLRVYVLTTKIDDPQKLFVKVPASWRWSKTPIWYTDMGDDKNTSYVLGIITQAYQSAPDL